jgi:tetratricopeptide (TPR) repeat protein
MRTDGEMFKGLIAGLIACAPLLLALSACSSVERIDGFPGSSYTNDRAAEESAYATFVRTIRPVQGNPEAHYLLGRYYQDRGKHRDAIAEFEKMLAMDGDRAKAFNAMGVSYDYLKEFQRASECYREALKIEPKAAGVYNNMGQSLLLQGDCAAAAQAFLKALMLDSANARVHNNLGRAYAMAGQTGPAIAKFEQAGKGKSAESTLARVLHEAEGRNEALEADTGPAQEETRRFVTRVEKFLRVRPIGEGRLCAAEPAGTAQAGSIAPDVYVEVSNGNGVDAMARDVGAYLKKRGFHVRRITNSARFDVARTCVYYEKRHARAASLLARQMPVAGKMRKAAGLYARRVDVKLVLGADVIPFRKKFTEGRS